MKKQESLSEAWRWGAGHSFQSLSMQSCGKGCCTIRRGLFFQETLKWLLYTYDPLTLWSLWVGDRSGLYIYVYIYIYTPSKLLGYVWLCQFQHFVGRHHDRSRAPKKFCPPLQFCLLVDYAEENMILIKPIRNFLELPITPFLTINHHFWTPFP